MNALLTALQHIDANAAESPEWIRRTAREAIAKATGPGSLLDTLANVTATLDNVLLHQGQHMTAEDLYQRRLLVASTRHTLQQHGIPT
jgi:hypothetical protein